MSYVHSEPIHRRSAIISAVLFAHFLVLYSAIVWTPAFVERLPETKIRFFNIIHVRQHLTPPMPLKLFAAISAPVAPFVPPPEIRINKPPSPIHTSTTKNITELTGYTQIPGNGSSQTGGRIAQLKTKPVFVGSKPNYPSIYKSSKQQGSVSIICMVHEDGRPGYCEFIDVVGGSAFGDAVMAWLHSGKPLYEPARLNGKPIRDTAILKVYFNPPE